MADTKKIISLVLQLAILVVLVVVAGYLIMDNKSEEADTSQEALNEVDSTIYGATVSYLEDTAQYKVNSETDWQTLATTTDVLEGYQLKAETGKLILTLDDGSAVRLNTGSEVVLTSLDPNQIIIENTAGEVYSRVMEANRTFSVVVGEVTYQAVGTAYTTLNTAEAKGVEVFQSSVKVLENNQEKDTVSEGEKFYQDKTEKEALTIEDKNDEFVNWNKEKDLSNENYKEKLGVLNQEEEVEQNQEQEDNQNTNQNQEQNQQQEQNTETNKNENQQQEAIEKIIFSAKVVEGGISFGWDPQGIDTSKGFKIVKNTTGSPTYPGSEYLYITESTQRAAFWNIQDGKTYYFRICQYQGGKCGIYSNQVQLTAPSSNSEKEVESISLIDKGNGKVGWTTSGYSDLGYKVVWSLNDSPVYPNREGDTYAYLSSPSASTHTINAFSGPGTYYVRVCEYLGGECGVYSNQITLTLE